MPRLFLAFVLATVTWMTAATAGGQESLLDASREVTRVIKLRSVQAPPIPTQDHEIAETVRSAADTMIDPSNIKFGAVQTTEGSETVTPSAASRRAPEPRVAQVPQYQQPQYQVQEFQTPENQPNGVWTQGNPIFKWHFCLAKFRDVRL